VIVLSELNGKESRLVAFRLGCDDFLPKPFELEELCLRVAKVLRTNPRPSRLEGALTASSCMARWATWR